MTAQGASQGVSGPIYECHRRAGSCRNGLGASREKRSGEGLTWPREMPLLAVKGKDELAAALGGSGLVRPAGDLRKGWMHRAAGSDDIFPARRLCACGVQHGVSRARIWRTWWRRCAKSTPAVRGRAIAGTLDENALLQSRIQAPWSCMQSEA